MDILENNETVNRKKKIPKRNRKKVLLFLFLFFLIAFLIGNHYASKVLQTKGYTGTWDFVKTVTANYWNGMDANPEKISIEIKDKDYKFLEKNRERALERNLIINNIDGDYVPATLEYNGKKMKIKLRLKGHMTDHLQDNKWSFRIKVKDKDSFMGMRRFSIQHPGTRGYVYEWIYHEMMRKEGIIALRYKFIDVTVNGRSWGIYAVEENFDKELIENNNRKNGPIVRFNPELYWVDRLNEIQHTKPVAEFASYYSSYIQPYNEDAVLNDSLQRNYFLKAMALMEGVRNRKISVADAFDIPRLAKFHAIIDLVGGEHSIDWSDIKYYYNPVTGKLEPVAYESFTNFPLREISGTYRYIQLDSSKENYSDWHTALFSNTEFYKEYVAELEKISQTKYLDDFFSVNNNQLSENLKILNKEFPYKKFDKQGYYRNQEMIKKILSPPQAFNAYFSRIADGKMFLKIGSIESLPTEIKSVTSGKETFISVSPIVLSSKLPNQYVNYKEYSFAIPSAFVWNDSLIKTIKINYSILGSSKTYETKVFPYPHTDSEFISEDLKNKKGNIKDFSFLLIDENIKTIFIKKGKQIITTDLIFPSGYKVIASGDISIDLKNHSRIISYSPFHFSGNEDKPITIESTDSSGQGIEIIYAAKSKFQNVTFKNLPKINDREWKRSGAVTFYESPVEFMNCIFINCKAEDAVNIIRSDFLFYECLFQNMHDDALDADYSEGTVTSCVFEHCNENAIDLTMCKVTLKSIVVNDAGNKAFNIKAGSELKGEDIKISESNIAISAEDMSSIVLKTVTISNSETGLVAYKNKPGAGHPIIKVNGLTLNKVKKNFLKEKKSSILVNGKEADNEVNDVEKIIKNDKKPHK